MEATFQTVVLKIVRNNELDHLQLILETCSEELDQSDKLVRNQTRNQSQKRLNPLVLQRISIIRDRKSRNLLQIAAKRGNLDVLDYLLELGFPVNGQDREGNNVVHFLLNYAKKSIKREEKNKKQAKKKKKSDHDSARSASLGYVQCCKRLEQILRQTNQPLLSMPNDEGIKPTELLQKLWSLASNEDRRIGDQILTQCVTQTSARCSYNEEPSSLNQSEIFGSDEPAEQFDENWEDYFSSFRDQGFRSHLDTIREEYERRKASTSSYSASKPSSNSNPPSRPMDGDQKRHEFHKRHAKAMAKKFDQPVIEHWVNFETYSKLWAKFVGRQSEPIRSFRDIEWPPFFEVNQSDQIEQTILVERVLDFVQHSKSKLRQLQIDWHPDRFLSRFGSRFQDEQLRIQVSSRVVTISQLLNAAVEKLRENARNS